MSTSPFGHLLHSASPCVCPPGRDSVLVSLSGVSESQSETPHSATDRTVRLPFYNSKTIARSPVVLSPSRVCLFSVCSLYVSLSPQGSLLNLNKTPFTSRGESTFNTIYLRIFREKKIGVPQGALLGPFYD